VTWLQRYRARYFIRYSFWFVPALCMLAALPAVRLVRWLDDRTGWPWLDFTAEGARGVLGGLSVSMLTFIVFAVSALLLAVQIASGQLTPRVIVLAFSRPITRFSVGLLVFSYTFALGALGRIEQARVPQLLVFVAIVTNLVSIVVFFRFVQQLGTSLRPVFILQSLWDAARRVVDRVYPTQLRPDGGPRTAPDGVVLAPSRVIEHIGSSGTFLAFGVGELVAVAGRADCTIQVVPEVGDFVSNGDALFRICPAGARLNEAALHHCVAFGPERTLEQDPAFALRIMVDIASRALSPAINDPTTAVLALDQIHRLLLYIGRKRLDPGRVRDEHGHVRLLYPTPGWEDFVALAVSEVRLFGSGSIQIPRRLNAMLEHLIVALPEPRRSALRQELALVRRAVERGYDEAEDRQLAHRADLQGLGGLPSADTDSPRLG